MINISKLYSKSLIFPTNIDVNNLKPVDWKLLILFQLLNMIRVKTGAVQLSSKVISDKMKQIVIFHILTVAERKKILNIV